MYSFIVNKEYNSVEEGDIYIQIIQLVGEYRKLFVVLEVDGEKVKLRRLSSQGGGSSFEQTRLFCLIVPNGN